MKKTIGCFMWLLSSLQAGAEPLVEGRVRLASGEPAAGAQVLLFDLTDLRLAPVAATTDEAGYFALPFGGLRSWVAVFPERFELGQNYPNPFNPSTIIPYQLAASTRVRLEIFNILGQRVKTLVDGERTAGFHTARWDATDAAGQAVGAGIYFYRLKGGGVHLTRRMLLIDGQAGIPSAVPGGPPAAVLEAEEATPVFGLAVSGAGLVPYVDPAFRVEAGMAPVDIVVEASGGILHAKVASGGILGDVDNNGRVDIFDALLVAVYSANPSLVMPNNGDITLGDVNRDGQTDLTDAYHIATYTVDPSDPTLPAGIGEALVQGTASLSPLPSTVSFQDDGAWHRFTVQAGEPIVVVANPTGTTPRVEINNLSNTNYCPAEANDDLTRQDGQDLVLAGCSPGTGTVELRRASDQTVLQTYTFTIQRQGTGGGDGGNAPDLIVDAPTVTNSSPAAGASFTLRTTVRNQGTGRSATTTLRYYRSTDATVSTGDTQVGTDPVSSLSASRTSSESISLRAPSSTGTYYYGACVESVSDETNTGNNCSAAVTVTVGAAPAPDLVVDAPTVTNSSPAAGASFTLRATVRNQGAARSGSTTLRYYRSTDATVSTSDTQVGTDPVSSLSASRTSSESISLRAPSSTGTYYYGACVESVTGETNTGNNCSAAVTLTVGAAPAPDLVVDAPTVTNSSPAAGASFTLRATVRNQGAARSSSTTLRYYRSTDATVSTSDTQVGTDPVSSLSASRTSSESISLRAPSSAGTYYYGACVESVTGETNTGNNCSAAVTLTVGAAPAPDLVVDAPTVTNSSPAAGASFTLRATVRNQGAARSSSTTLRYYRSTDATVSTSDTQVGTDPVSSLSASRTSSESISLRAPSSAGTYYYGACVESVSGETNTGNNCSPAITVTVPGTVTQPTPQPGASKLYWSDWGTDKIQRADLDGSNVEDLVTGAGLNGPDGLSLDLAGGKIYWADAGTNKIQRANLDGSGVEDLVTGLGIPYGLALDLAGGKMYWTNRQTGKIQRANLSGSGVEDLVTSGLTFPGALALDTAGGKMYWTNPGATKIQRANLSGSNVEDLVTSGLSSPTGLALDVAGGKMYWTDRGSDKIQRANLSGSGVEDLVTSGLHSPNGMALDVAGGKMYWADAGTDKVQRANLNGSGVEDLLTSTDGLVDPSGIAIGGSAGVTPDTGVGGGGGGATQTRTAFESSNPSGYTQITLDDGGRVWGVPTKYTTDTNTGTVAYMVLGSLKGCAFANAEADGQRIVYVKTQSLGRLSNFESDTVCRKASSQWSSSWSGLRITHIRFFDESSPTNVSEAVYNASTGQIELGGGGDGGGGSNGGGGTSPAPDLVVDAPTVSNSSPTAGASFTLRATVRNQGTGRAGSTTLRYYRSSDATVSTSDTQVGTDPVSTLSASRTSSESISLSAPSNAGTYYYGACVESVSDETNTGNNCSSPVTVTVGAAPAPDLVVEAPTVTNSSPTAGASFTLSATVRNQGTGRAGSTTLRYYRSSDATVSTSDTQVGTDPVSTLSASRTSSESISLSAPSSTGTYYYGACVESVSDETDTGNNCSSAVTVTVGAAPAPDLVVEAPTVTNSSPAAGASFTLRATVRNQGAARSSSTTLRYYRSTDATVSTSDTQVGTDPVSSLSASRTSSESISLSAPSTTGTYYYGACVESVSGETNTGNNCSSAVTVTVPGTVTQPDPQPSGASKLYWSDWGTDKIQRADLDGSNVEDLVTGAGLDGPDGLSLDLAGGKIYWADAGTNKIQRANLDGSGAEDLVTGLGIPYGLALDLAGGKMYWTNRQTGKIQRANLNGSGVEDLVTSGLTFPGALALDAAGGKMYWTNSGATKIQRANLSGSNVEDLVTSGLSSPTGLALDVAGGKMYWTDRGTDKIQRANLSGSGVEDLVTSGLNSPNGLALDVAGGKMYWADAGTDKVQRANLNGSGVEDLLTSTDGLVDPSGIAIGGTAQTGSGGGGGGGGGTSSAPDLVVDAPTVNNSSPTAGASFTLSATVRNQGTGRSGSTTLRYYRSSDATVSTSDTEVGTDPVSTLSASRTSSESIFLSAPSNALEPTTTAPASRASATKAIPGTTAPRP